MEEVDRVLFASLQRLGWEAEGEGLASLSGAEVMEALIRCLWALQPASKAKLPTAAMSPHMTARFKQASAVAELIGGLGYRGEIGYQTILYGTQAQIRPLLLFLVERLPSEEATTETAQVGSSALSPLIDEARTKLRESLDEPWLPYWYPHYCRRQKLVWRGNLWHDPDTLSASVHAPTASSSNDVQALRKSLREAATTSEEARKSEKPPLRPKPKLPPKPGPKPILNETNEEAKKKEAEDWLEVRRTMREVEEESHSLRASIKASAAKTEALRRSQAQAESSASLKELRRWAAALASPAEAAEGLKRYLSESEARVAALERRWEEGSAPLRAEIARLKEARGGGADGGESQRLRSECAGMLEEAEAKSSLQAHLEKELGRAEAGLKREAYTKRILEILASVSRQRAETEKVTRERLEVEAEANRTRGRLERSMAAAEALMFPNAKRDADLARAYKLLHALHESAAKAVEVSSSAVGVEREAAALEESLQRRDASAMDGQLERILGDLQEANAARDAIRNSLANLHKEPSNAQLPLS